GRVIDAAEMLRLGLTSAVYDDQMLLDEVLARAGEVAAGAPIAARLHKEALRDGGPASLERALQWEALAQPVTMATADLQEGLRAQSEKRPPVFRGE